MTPTQRKALIESRLSRLSAEDLRESMARTLGDVLNTYDRILQDTAFPGRKGKLLKLEFQRCKLMEVLEYAEVISNGR